MVGKRYISYPHKFRQHKLILNNLLKVAIIGLGVGFKHLEALFHHDACHLVAACDFDKARLKEVEKRYPNLQTTTSAD